MKKVLSLTHTIVTCDPEFVGATIDNPPGTVIEMDDEEAASLITRALAVEWDPAIHGATPAEIAARARNPQTLTNPAPR